MFFVDPLLINDKYLDLTVDYNFSVIHCLLGNQKIKLGSLYGIKASLFSSNWRTIVQSTFMLVLDCGYILCC